MWWNLNKVMANNGVPNLNFKGFMVDNVHANWNVVQIIYGSEDLSESMVNRE
jgi:predicted phage tail protein